MASSILVIVIATLVLGIGSQILADRFDIPSIIFLIAAGITAGPEILGVVRPEAFGEGLQILVGLSVAIIVFEGAFQLKISKLKKAQSEAIKLGTIGAVLSGALTALAAYHFLSVSPDIALVIGTLLIATGPTVIKPIMDVVSVRKKVEAALETEGIVNDVSASILALVVYEFLVIKSAEAWTLVSHFVMRWGVGLFMGIITAFSAYHLIQNLHISNSKKVKDSRLVVFAAALVAYGLSDLVIAEAGIAAAATSGIILGNLDLPYEFEIEDFMETVTVVFLTFIFIVLTALLSFDSLLALGTGGLFFVAAVILVIRPITVFSSTIGSEFTNSEKLYVSIIGPRGIIPASVATLFALELQKMGRSTEASVLVGGVFIVILATSILEGGMSKIATRLLHVNNAEE